MKTRVISGITATGKLTLGNYIGAINNLLKTQEDDSKELLMFLADFHALTIPLSPKLLKENIKQQLALYIACGIDVKKTKLFRQSEIIGHSELFYYLTCNSMLGQLNRMTQFKDKSIKNNNGTEMIPTGLLMYPVLMAADILLYNSDEVIVGIDQKQHVELTRDLAIRMNSTYNLNLKIPEPIISKVGSKIMALKNPLSKMSKSDNDVNNTIFLLDEPETIFKKIMSSVTDSENLIKFDIKNKPGVSNLLTIYSALKKININEAENLFKNKDYKEFKEEVAKTIIDVLKPIQDKYYSITENEIKNALKINREYLQKIANECIIKIEKGLGIK